MYNIFRCFLSVAFFLLSSSCDLIEPNNRFFNEKATPFQIKTLDIAEISPGKHIAGMFWFSADLDSIEGQIQRVDLYVDSILESSSNGPPYNLFLNTEKWPEGEHLLIITVIKIGASGGLLGLVGAPSIVYTAPVVFDQTPPSPVVLDIVTWENGFPRLIWTQNHDPNFYAYIISRQGLWTGNPPFVGAGIDTIFNQSTTTYIDTVDLPPLPLLPRGARLDYSVMVNNHADFSLSNMISIDNHGDTLSASPLGFGQNPKPIISPNRDEMYIVQPDGLDDILKAVSTTNNTVVRTHNLNSFENFALSKDGTKLYVVSDNIDLLTTIDVNTFDVIAMVNLPFSGGSVNSIVAGRANRLYMTTNQAKIINPETGVEVGEIAIDLNNGLLAISPDNNTLYAAKLNDVYKVDVSTDSGQVILHRQSSHNIQSMQLSPDGQRLYLGHVYTAPSNFIEIWDTDDLTSIAQISAPVDQQHFDFYVTTSHIYMSHSIDIPEVSCCTSGRVVQYDAQNLAPLNFWDFVQIPTMIVVSRDNQYLYAFGFKSWITQLF